MQPLHRRSVAYLIIGGVHYLLRHPPVLTFDLNIWIEDSPENRARCVDWSEYAARALSEKTPFGVPYRGLCDRDTLAGQLALEEPRRKLDRIRRLSDIVNRTHE